MVTFIIGGLAVFCNAYSVQKELDMVLLGGQISNSSSVRKMAPRLFRNRLPATW